MVCPIFTTSQFWVNSMLIDIANLTDAKVALNSSAKLKMKAYDDLEFNVDNSGKLDIMGTLEKFDRESSSGWTLQCPKFTQPSVHSPCEFTQQQFTISCA